MSNETLDMTILDLDLEVPAYEPPEGGFEVGERELPDRSLRLHLYVGGAATLDIVHLGDESTPDFLVRRIEQTPDHALDLLKNPQRYLSASESRYFFDGAKAA